MRRGRPRAALHHAVVACRALTVAAVAARRIGTPLVKARVAKAGRALRLTADPVGILRRNFLQKARRLADARAAKEHALARAGHREALSGTRHRNIAEPALLLDFIIVVAHTLAGEDPFLHADDIHAGELKALRAVHRHHRHAVVARGAVKIGVECDLIEKARKCRVLRVIFKERENVRLEFLHVFQPSAALHVALFPKRAHVARLLADKLVEFRKLRRFRRLPQRADEGGKALELARRVLEHGILPRALQNSHHRDILLVCQHLHTLDRRAADAARRIVDDAPQTQIVARVVDDGKIRKHVLDLGALEELGAAHDLIRYAVAFEGVFERVRLCVHAVQHGIFFPVPAAVVVHHDAADDKICLVLLVENRLDEHAVARARIGPESLALPASVVLDDGVRRVEDILRGAVVLLQADRAAALVFLFKVQNIRDVRAAEFVNALVIVADDADIALFPHELLHQKILQAVRVLILVDEHITELAAVVLAHLALLLQQRDRMEKNVVKVERVCLGESLHIADINPGNGFLAPVAAVFPAAGIILRRLHRVLRIRDGRKHLARRELLFINIQFFQDILDDALGIVRIVDRKIA